MRKTWPFLVNAFLYGGYAFVMPFLVLYYQSIGFSGFQIGLLAGLSPLITFFGAPLWARLGDVTRRHKWIMGFCLFSGAGLIALFPFFRDFYSILVLAILYNICFAPTTSFTDSATMHMLGDQKDKYGQIRVGGSFGFAITAMVAGVVIENWGLRIAFFGSGALFFLAFLASLGLSYRTHLESTAGIGIRLLLRDRRWILFFMLAFAGGMALSAASNYLLPLLKGLGASESEMGVALALGTASEFPILIFGHKLIRRFRPHGLLLLTMVITGVRLLLVGAAPSPAWVLILQLFNGFTFAAMWMAGVSYADQNAPPGMSTTVQGLFGAMNFGVGNAVGGFIGGVVLGSLGNAAIFYLIGGLDLAVIAAVIALGWMTQRGTGKPETSVIPADAGTQSAG